MKSIVYILIAVFISSILISAFPKSVKTEQQNYTLHCVDKPVSQNMLEASAEIIKSRLIDYGLDNIELTLNSKTSSIELSIDRELSFHDASTLLTSKGCFEFYETYNRLEIIEKLGTDNNFGEILSIPSTDKTVDGCSGIYGYCKEANKQKVELYLKKHYVSKPNQGIKFFWSAQANKNGNYNLFLLKQSATLDNSSIAESSVNTDLSDKRAEININFNTANESIWRAMTKRNIGQSIAIVLDQEVLLAPIVQSEIIGGKSTISGNFKVEELRLINALINNKELPLNFELKK